MTETNTKSDVLSSSAANYAQFLPRGFEFVVERIDTVREDYTEVEVVTTDKGTLTLPTPMVGSLDGGHTYRVAFDDWTGCRHTRKFQRID
jgi:hypothetical protein